MSEYFFNSHGRARPPLIVLAEDDEDTRRVYGIILRHFGYRVEEAQDGLEAIEVVRATKPDLVLMDVNLPRLDGQRASRALKADPETRSIPIIAFSADISTTAELPTGGSTFDGYILKPISPSELVRRVASFLEHRASSGLYGVRQTGEVEIPYLERGHHDITA